MEIGLKDPSDPTSLQRIIFRTPSPDLELIDLGQYLYASSSNVHCPIMNIVLYTDSTKTVPVPAQGDIKIQ